MIIEMIEGPLEIAAQVIDLIGISILVIAAAKFLYHYGMFEYERYQGMNCVLMIRDLRLQLGSYILLALEFMIIGDVIHSALTRTLDEFLLLGILVIIRTALSYFLALDLKEAQKEKEEASG